MSKIMSGVVQDGSSLFSGVSSALSSSDSSVARLVIVVGELSDDSRTQILLRTRLVEDLSSSWNASLSRCDLNKELKNFVNAEPIKNSTPTGEVTLVYQSSVVHAEVLVNIGINTLNDKLTSLRTDGVKDGSPFALVVYVGLIFPPTGLWLLRDGPYLPNNGSPDTPCPTVFEISGRQGLERSSNVEREGINAFCSHLLEEVCLPPTVKDPELRPSSFTPPQFYDKPTMYVFPCGQGTSAFFGMGDFSVLVDAGYGRDPLCWDLIRQKGRLDALLVTHLGIHNLFGTKSMLEKMKATDEFSRPKIGHAFLNCWKRNEGSSTVASAKKNLVPEENKETMVNWRKEATSIVHDLEQLGIDLHPCVSDGMETHACLYHKVGVGSVCIDVLHPNNDEQLKQFLESWKEEDATDVGVADSKVPAWDTFSVCAVLHWVPAPHGKPIRVLLTGGAPESVVCAGLEKLKRKSKLEGRNCLCKDACKYPGNDCTIIETAKKPEDSKKGKNGGRTQLKEKRVIVKDSGPKRNGAVGSGSMEATQREAKQRAKSLTGVSISAEAKKCMGAKGRGGVKVETGRVKGGVGVKVETLATQTAECNDLNDGSTGTKSFDALRKVDGEQTDHAPKKDEKQIAENTLCGIMKRAKKAQKTTAKRPNCQTKKTCDVNASEETKAVRKPSKETKEGSGKSSDFSTSDETKDGGKSSGEKTVEDFSKSSNAFESKETSKYAGKSGNSLENKEWKEALVAGSTLGSVDITSGGSNTISTDEHGKMEEELEPVLEEHQLEGSTGEQIAQQRKEVAEMERERCPEKVKDGNVVLRGIKKEMGEPIVQQQIEQPPKEIEQPPKKIEQPPKKIEQPPKKIEQPPKKIEQPPKKIEQPPKKIEQPPKEIEQPPKEIEQPSKEIEQQPKEIEQPPKKIEQPPKKIEQPPKEIEQPSKEIEQLSKEIEQPPKKIEQPPKKIEKPPKKIERPPKKIEQPPKEIEQPPKEIEQPPKEIEQPPKEIEQPSKEIEQPPKETEQPCAEKDTVVSCEAAEAIRPASEKDMKVPSATKEDYANYASANYEVVLPSEACIVGDITKDDEDVPLAKHDVVPPSEVSPAKDDLDVPPAEEMVSPSELRVTMEDQKAADDGVDVSAAKHDVDIPPAEEVVSPSELCVTMEDQKAADDGVDVSAAKHDVDIPPAEEVVSPSELCVTMEDQKAADDGVDVSAAKHDVDIPPAEEVVSPSELRVTMEDQKAADDGVDVSAAKHDVDIPPAEEVVSPSELCVTMEDQKAADDGVDVSAAKHDVDIPPAEEVVSPSELRVTMEDQKAADDGVVPPTDVSAAKHDMDIATADDAVASPLEVAATKGEYEAVPPFEVVADKKDLDLPIEAVRPSDGELVPPSEIPATTTESLDVPPAAFEMVAPSEPSAAEEAVASLFKASAAKQDVDVLPPVEKGMVTPLKKNITKKAKPIPSAGKRCKVPQETPAPEKLCSKPGGVDVLDRADSLDDLPAISNTDQLLDYGSCDLVPPTFFHDPPFNVEILRSGCGNNFPAMNPFQGVAYKDDIFTELRSSPGDCALEFSIKRKASSSSDVEEDSLDGDNDECFDPAKTWEPMNLPEPELPKHLSNAKVGVCESNEPRKKKTNVRNNGKNCAANDGGKNPKPTRETRTKDDKSKRIAADNLSCDKIAVQKTTKAEATRNDLSETVPVSKASEQKSLTPTNSDSVYFTVAFIPGRGEPQYVSKLFFQKVRARYYVLSSLSHDTSALDSLLEAKEECEEEGDGKCPVSVFPTHGSLVLEEWVASHAEKLSRLSVDVRRAADDRCGTAGEKDAFEAFKLDL